MVDISPSGASGYTRQKSIEDGNPEDPTISQHKINIHEVLTPDHTVLTHKHNELFVQQVVRDTHCLEGESLALSCSWFE